MEFSGSLIVCVYGEDAMLSTAIMVAAAPLQLHDAALLCPGLGCIANLIGMFRLAARPRELAGAPHGRFRVPLQDRILGHGDYIFQLGALPHKR